MRFDQRHVGFGRVCGKVLLPEGGRPDDDGTAVVVIGPLTGGRDVVVLALQAYGLEIRPVIGVTTCGGVKIDQSART